MLNSINKHNDPHFLLQLSEHTHAPLYTKHYYIMLLILLSSSEDRIREIGLSVPGDEPWSSCAVTRG